MKAASIYKRDGRYYIFPECVTEVGVGVVCGSPAIIDSTDGISRYVLNAFLDSKTGIPHPRDLKEHQRWFYGIFGVRSSGMFHKGTVVVGATEQDGTITLLPFRNGGAKKGFEGISEKATQIAASASAPEMDAAIVKAILAAE